MQKTILCAAILMALSGCTAPVQKKETYDLIKAEINQALAENTAAAEFVTRAKAQQDIKSVKKEERFNVAINNAPAAQFFYSIASDTPYNMIVHPDVAGSISAHLKGVTLFETLDVIREMYGFDYRVEGNRISIRPLSMQMRVFKINYLTGSRDGTSDTRVNSGSVTDSAAPSSAAGAQAAGAINEQAFHSSKISTTSHSDFWRELKESLDAILGSTKDGKNVIVSPQSGLITVRAMPEDMRNISEYLKATQAAVGRQVVLEAKILEVQLSDQSQSGVNWAAFGNYRDGTRRAAVGLVAPGSTLLPLSATGAATPLSSGQLSAVAGQALGAAASASSSLLGLAFQTSNFSALLSFLESQGTVHVLSSPRIATLNNQKALLKVGTEDFFVTNVSTTTTTGAATTQTPSVTLQPFFSGIVLDVTPQISDDGHVVLHVHPAVSQVSTNERQVNLGANIQLNLPLASSNISETDSIIRGQNGRIFAIGGLMRQASTSNQSQVPGAGDVPVVNSLFKNTSNSLQKRELVILIKPTVIDDDNQDYGLRDAQDRMGKMSTELPTKTLLATKRPSK